MFPKKGRLFPRRNDRDSVLEKFPALVARALLAELGPSHRAAKTLMRWTDASERTVKQWLTGTHGPRGEHLIALLRESDEVFESVMIAADRLDVVLAARALAARTLLEDFLLRSEGRAERPPRKRSHDAREHQPGRSGTEDDRENDRDDDRKDDRDSDSKGGPSRSGLGTALNLRQLWYLEALRSGVDVRAADLRNRWGVSEKTARRDLAALKARQLIGFSGSRRRGRYRAEG